MKIAFVGDPHGDFSYARAASQNADVVILLGDQTPARPLSEELGEAASKCWYILGNHDCDRAEWYDNHDLPGRDLHARVVRLGGIRIGGLGGHFQGKIWMPCRHHEYPEVASSTARQFEPRWENRAARLAALGHRTWRGGLPLRLRCAIFPGDLAHISPAEILVCHEAPESHRFGFRAIGDLARVMRVSLIVHGHHHGQEDQHYETYLESGIKVVGLVEGDVFTIETGNFASEYLRAYSDGRMGLEEAMEWTGLKEYSQLVESLRELGLPLPQEKASGDNQ